MNGFLDTRVKPGSSPVDRFVMTLNDGASRRVRQLKRWFKEAWSKGWIMAVPVSGRGYAHRLGQPRPPLGDC